jgi:hypothetical protein
MLKYCTKGCPSPDVSLLPKGHTARSPVQALAGYSWYVSCQRPRYQGYVRNRPKCQKDLTWSLSPSQVTGCVRSKLPFPNNGPIVGGGLVEVPFVHKPAWTPGQIVICRFGTQTSQGYAQSSDIIMCPSPLSMTASQVPIHIYDPTSLKWVNLGKYYYQDMSSSSNHQHIWPWTNPSEIARTNPQEDVLRSDDNITLQSNNLGLTDIQHWYSFTADLYEYVQDTTSKEIEEVLLSSIHNIQ